MALPPDMPDVTSSGSQKKRLPDDMPLLAHQRPEFSSSSYPLPRNITIAAMLGASNKQIADGLRKLNDPELEVLGDDAVNWRGNIYLINREGISGADIGPTAVEQAASYMLGAAATKIPGARNVISKIPGAGWAMKKGGALKEGAVEALLNMGQDVAFQKAAGAAVGDEQGVDAGRTATVGAVAGAAPLALKGLKYAGEKAWKYGVPKLPGMDDGITRGRKIESETASAWSPEELAYAQERAAVGDPLLAYQHPLMLKRLSDLQNDAQAARKVYEALGIQSDKTVEAADRFVERISPMPGHSNVDIEGLVSSTKPRSAEFAKQVNDVVRDLETSTRVARNKIYTALKEGARSSTEQLDLKPVIDLIEEMKKPVPDVSTRDSLSAVQDLLTTKAKDTDQFVDNGFGMLVPNPNFGKNKNTTIWDPNKDIFLAKNRISDMINGKIDGVSIDKYTASRLIDVMDKLDEMIESHYVGVGGETLLQAKRIYVDGLEKLDTLRNSLLGDVAEAHVSRDTEGIIRLGRMFFDHPTVNPQNAKILNAMIRRNPKGDNAMNELIADRFAGLKGDSTDVRLSTGERASEVGLENTPQKYKNAMFGSSVSEKEKSIRKAVMTPDQLANADAFEKLLDWNMLGRKMGAESPTTPLLLEAMRKSGTGGVQDIPNKAWSIFVDKTGKAFGYNQRRAVAEAIADPKWADDMKLFRDYMHRYDRLQNNKDLETAARIMGSITSRAAGRYSQEH